MTCDWSSDVCSSDLAYRDLDAGLGNEVDHVLGAAIQLGVSPLAAEALHFRDRHARDADIGQRGAHVVELERLDDRCDQFHGRGSPWRGGAAREDVAAFMPCCGLKLNRGSCASRRGAGAAHCPVLERTNCRAAPLWCG